MEDIEQGGEQKEESSSPYSISMSFAGMRNDVGFSSSSKAGFGFATTSPDHVQYLSLETSQQAETTTTTTNPPHHLPSRKSVLRGLSEALMRRSLTKIDLSQRGLGPGDARLIKMALVQNANVQTLKLGYNNLGDEGVEILVQGIAEHATIESLDLGFNNIGDEGCRILCDALPVDGRAYTLYLAGNLISEDGAMAIADFVRRSNSVRKLYLTGNRLGPAGVKAVSDAILEAELSARGGARQNPSRASEEDADMSTGGSSTTFVGTEKLFLGGTCMGMTGCEAVARLVERTNFLRTLSLSNCDIGDDAMAIVCNAIKNNRENLPLESLQLSFNNLSCRGIEHISNALWGSTTLKELLLDNNDIGDNGAQLISAVLPYIENLETLNVGFNKLKSAGMKLLMKSVADSRALQSLSVAGNNVDTMSAKFIAYALAHNCSLRSVSLDHCSIGAEGQRQIVAGIVSNSNTVLREIRGFNIGPVIVTLGFPAVMEHWNNEHVINFIHLMWDRTKSDTPASEEKSMDPLHFLPGSTGQPGAKTAPIDANAVVEIAKKAFDSLVENGVDVFSRRRNGHSYETASPIEADAIMFGDPPPEDESDTSIEAASIQQSLSFVAPPEESAKTATTDPSRKKRIVEWLCSNIQHLKKLSQKPFSSAELWQLHQHYFTPVVNESGGSVAPSPNPSADLFTLAISSVPEVSRASSSENQARELDDSIDGPLGVPASDPSMKASPNAISSLPLLKRKVSYRFLGDAALTAASRPELPSPHPCNSQKSAPSVSMMIEGGPTGHSLPPKTKKARRNRTRISFLPRVKAKLDSYLDVCHEKALVTMRQLYYVEQAIMKGEVNPIDPKTTARTHLCGDFATDAEMIIVDMI